MWKLKKRCELIAAFYMVHPVFLFLGRLLGTLNGILESTPEINTHVKPNSLSVAS